MRSGDVDTGPLASCLPVPAQGRARTRVGKLKQYLSNCWRLSVDKLKVKKLQGVSGGPPQICEFYLQDLHHDRRMKIREIRDIPLVLPIGGGKIIILNMLRTFCSLKNKQTKNTTTTNSLPSRETILSEPKYLGFIRV